MDGSKAVPRVGALEVGHVPEYPFEVQDELDQLSRTRFDRLCTPMREVGKSQRATE